MHIIEALLLGILQGVTEFLPVSSSGHLVLGQALLGQDLERGITYEIVVHFGSLFSIVVCFWPRLLELTRSLVHLLRNLSRFRELWTEDYNVRFAAYVVISMIPAFVVGFTLKSQIEGLFGNPVLVSLMLMVTGTVLFVTRFLPESGKLVNPGRGFLVGCAQALAIIPGISRSGSTIAAGLMLGLKRKEVADFSFIMVIPVLAGAMALETVDVFEAGLRNITVTELAAGFLASFLAGVVALKFLIRLLRNRSIHVFAYYCWPAGLLCFLYFAFVAAP